MKFGISGASGQLGKSAIIELGKRASEHEIVGVSRTPDSVPAPAHGIFGDYDAPDKLLGAYQDLDRLMLIPSPDTRPGIRENHFINAIDAAVEAGVNHILMISSCASRQWSANTMYAPYFIGEQYLMKKAQNWTILRMNYYAETFAGLALQSLQNGVLYGLAQNRVGLVSRKDLAASAAGILLGEGHEGAIYNATGPASLSGPERAAIVQEVSGNSLIFEVVDESTLRAHFKLGGIPAHYIDALIDIEKSFALGCFDIVTGDVERLSGHSVHSLRDVMSEVMASRSKS